MSIPPHLLPMLRSHLNRYTGTWLDALLFAAVDGRQLSPNRGVIRGRFR
ncbi:hypothetical protein [Pengzhenrongella sp.]